jgi:hypothetical protein
LQPGSVGQLDKPGPAQQGPESQVTEGRAVEFAKMRIAPGGVEQQGIANVEKRWAILSPRQRAEGGSSGFVKGHEISFRSTKRDEIWRKSYPRFGSFQSWQEFTKDQAISIK